MARGKHNVIQIFLSTIGFRSTQPLTLSGMRKWVVAYVSYGVKAGMAHSIYLCVQVKLWDPLITRVIPECLRGVYD